ncbi:MAG: hypothetical protein Q7S23_04270 [bacterium]|nr:hypothetical protein [bacterium]
MELRLDTTVPQRVTALLLNGRRVVARASAATPFHGTERILPLIAALLRGRSRPLSVTVVHDPQGLAGFTQLRAGAVAANALGYAWGVPVASVAQGEIVSRRGKHTRARAWVQPRYRSAPNVTAKS